MISGRRIGTAALVFIGALVSAGALLASEPILTPEMVVDLRIVNEVEISPDGSRIAYTLVIPRGGDEDPGPSHRELWVVPFTGGIPKCYLAAPDDCDSPCWSPDGTRLAFISARGDEDNVAQIWVMPLDIGEAEKITALESSASQPRWSPDGRSVAFIATDPKTEEEKERQKAGKDWEVVDQEYKHHRLWVVDVETREIRKITESDESVWDFSWSPDGTEFAVTASPTPRTDDSYMFRQLYTVPARGGELTQLCETHGKLKSPSWSPDGRAIAILSAVDLADPRAGSVFLVSAESGAKENLTPDFPGTVEWAAWVDGKNIAFVATEDMRSTLNLSRVKDRKTSPVETSWAIFSGASFSRDGKRFALSASAPYHPPEVLVGDTGGGVTRRTTHNPELNDVELGEQTTVYWNSSSDALRLGGILVKPVGFAVGKRYPLVVEIHGGPEHAYLDGWNTYYSRWSQLLAARGFLVFLPNYRGSTGRGVEFLKGDQRDLAGLEFQDVLDGIDHLVSEGLADAARVGIGGGSYGGYFSAWAATRHSDRFQAAVVFAGITNWLSFMGTTDIPAENALVHWDLWCYDSPELCWERSPLAHLNRAHTPTLIAHGEKDLRVPLSQGWELYQAFRVRGVETEFVIYPREPHGLRERSHKIDFANRVLDWYERYLR